eukprot:TRINITY_DN10095_c0_g1_i2.p4 TRINITY_DN10095_c0_g1~~TRINITY_DN10095_c0_g1_i2.p4  ORF type:complete len:205 (+),score=3.48 TRINITY_DN10095_c0_g1_i2:621-1235(+)
MASIARGNADSELVVANAMDAGSEIARIKFFIGIFKNKITGNKTRSKKQINATQSVARSLKRLYRISNPKCPTVQAMAAKTASGARYITRLVNLNIVSERLSVKRNIGWRFFSPSMATAIPKIMLNITICKTCPSQMDLAIFSGKICKIISLVVCFVIPCAMVPVSYTHLTLPTICSVQISVVAVSLKKKRNNNVRCRRFERPH